MFAYLTFTNSVFIQYLEEEQRRQFPHAAWR